MARSRGKPTLASRHSAGRSSSTAKRFESGYQYSYPQDFHVTLGPWDRIWPLGTRNAPPSVLQALHDGMLRDGAIYGVWRQVDSTVSSAEVVGLYEFSLLSVVYRILFWRDTAAGVLKVMYDDGSTTTTVSAGVSPASGIHVVAAPWQDKLYFTWDGAASIYELNTTTDAVAAVAGSPASAEFLLFINDQLIAIYLSGISYLVAWTVNADPTDWAGAGSGSTPVPGEMGRPQGLVEYKQDGMLITRHGAVQISATGTSSPSFRVTKRQDITGAIWTHRVVSDGDQIFYVTNDRQLAVYDSAERRVGEGGETFDNEVAAIRDRGGMIVRVTRVGLKPPNGHVSEQFVDRIDPDYEITANEGDLDALAAQAKHLDSWLRAE